MSAIVVAQRNPYLERPPSSSLADVVDLILDKGLVADTYLRFAEAVGRLSLDQQRLQPRTLPDLLEDLKPSPPKFAKEVLHAGRQVVSKARKVEQRVRGENGNGKSEGS